MKYLIYALVGLLILWSAGYLIYDFHKRLKGKRGCGCGGCESCPHKGAGVFCGKRGATRQSRAFRGGTGLACRLGRRWTVATGDQRPPDAPLRSPRGFQ